MINKIDAAVAYIARAINVFYGLIALVGLIIFVIKFELFGIALFKKQGVRSAFDL